jgi:hypothetical protein
LPHLTDKVAKLVTKASISGVHINTLYGIPLNCPATQPIVWLYVRYDGGYTPAMFAYMRYAHNAPLGRRRRLATAEGYCRQKFFRLYYQQLHLLQLYFVLLHLQLHFTTSRCPDPLNALMV